MPTRSPRTSRAAIEVVDWSAREDALDGAATIVNATSLGMLGKPPLELGLDAAPRTALVTDWSTTRSRRRCSRRRGRAECRPSTGSACCCTRPGRGSAPGSGRTQRSPTPCATPAWRPADDRPRPDGVDRHGQVDDGGDVRRGRRAGLGCRCGGAPPLRPRRRRQPGARRTRARRRWPRPAPTGRGCAPRSSPTPVCWRRSRPRSIRSSPPTGRPSSTVPAAEGHRLVLCDIPLLFETGAERWLDRVAVVTAPADVQRDSRAGAPRHDRASLRRNPCQSRCRMRKNVRGRISSSTPGRVWSLSGGRWPTDRRADDGPRADGGSGCVRSCSTPRPPASTRPTATGSSRSARSSWSTTCRPAACSTSTSIPSGRCRARRWPCTGSTTASCATSRVFASVAEALLAFLAEAPLVIHNAGFDIAFLNAEFARLRRIRRCR